MGERRLILNKSFKRLKYFLGVKPYQICPLLEEYQGILDQRSNLLTGFMAAGLELKRWLT